MTVAPTHPPQKSRPSWAWFLVGIALVALGVILAAVILVLTLGPALDTDAKVRADGQPHQVSVPTDGERMLWRIDDEDADPGCRIVDTATGEPIPLRSVGADVTRDTGDGDWLGLYRFDPGSGQLEVTCRGESAFDQNLSGDDLNGDDFDAEDDVLITPALNIGYLIGGVLAAIALGALLVLFGVATMIVTGVLWATRPAKA